MGRKEGGGRKLRANVRFKTGHQRRRGRREEATHDKEEAREREKAISESTKKLMSAPAFKSERTDNYRAVKYRSTWREKKHTDH